MHSVNLNDSVYAKAAKVAKARGFGSVDDFLTDVVETELRLEEADLDALFTPEVMAAIDEGLADAEAGRVFTVAEVRAEFAKRAARRTKQD